MPVGLPQSIPQYWLPCMQAVTAFLLMVLDVEAWGWGGHSLVEIAWADPTNLSTEQRTAWLWLDGFSPEF
jgi:hypothetical protein